MATTQSTSLVSSDLLRRERPDRDFAIAAAVGLIHSRVPDVTITPTVPGAPTEGVVGAEVDARDDGGGELRGVDAVNGNSTRDTGPDLSIVWK